jgi:hypothetical protein
LTNPLLAATDRPFTGAFLYTPDEHLPLSLLGAGFKDGLNTAFSLEHGKYLKHEEKEETQGFSANDARDSWKQVRAFPKNKKASTRNVELSGVVVLQTTKFWWKEQMVTIKQNPAVMVVTLSEGIGILPQVTPNARHVLDEAKKPY